MKRAGKEGCEGGLLRGVVKGGLEGGGCEGWWNV